MTPPAELLAGDKQHVLEHTANLWEPLRGQRLFVTGGTGFVGTWLLQSFAWANRELGLGAQAVVLSRNWQAFCEKAPQLAADPSIFCYMGDVRDFAFPPGHFSHIIHAVTESRGKLNEADPLAMFDTVAHGTRHTLEFAQHCGAQRFFLVSSGAVYGRQPPELAHVSEDYAGAPDPMSPHSAYGEAKRVAEHLGAIYAQRSSLEVAIARGFTFIGPYLLLEARYAIGNFIRDGLRGGPITVRGDGTPLRAYLYTADMAVWLWNVFLRGKSCRPYNVGSEEAVSVGELAHIVADCFQPRPEVQILESPTPGKPAERYVPSCRRAETELELQRRVELPDAIARTVRWHTARRS